MEYYEAPSQQRQKGPKKYFRLSVFDDKHFALKFYQLDAEEFTYVHNLVGGFPERKFRRAVSAWIIPFAQATFEYLEDHFKPEEYALDPEAKLVLDYHSKTDRSLQLREQRRWKYIFNDEVPTIQFDFTTTPFKHQTVGLDALHNAEYFGLLMETGTGKTKVIVDELRWNSDEREAKGQGGMRVLIVCPKSVRGIWVHELAKHLPKDYPVWIRRCKSRVGLIQDFIDGVHSEAKLKVWIINYDRLKTNAESLQTMRFDLIVADESTRIKSPRTKRSKALRELGETAARRIILTGTPIGNNILDLWSQFQFLQPGCLGYDSFPGFKARYARVRKVQNWEKIEGWQNIDELKARMARCSFVVKKRDCLDLPPKTYVTRSVEMGDRQRLLYEDMLENFIASLDEDFTPQGTMKAQIILTKLLRLSQICSGFLKPEEGLERPIPGGATKIEALDEIVDEMNPDEKFIVWCRFKYDIKVVRAYCIKKKIKVVEIHGGISEAGRDRARESFNDDYGARCFIGEPGSGGEGITLIGTDAHPCTTAIYYSSDFSLLKRLQSEDRCHRIGTKLPVTYIDICCEDSVDETICERLQLKKDLSEMIKDYSSIKDLLLGSLKRLRAA